ncbi:hypothetical protein APS65_02135 [Bifidobacterium longum]|nr:hypothetical protein APS65_02135 [Bifidobacterium longum]
MNLPVAFDDSYTNAFISTPQDDSFRFVTVGLQSADIFTGLDDVFHTPLAWEPHLFGAVALSLSGMAGYSSSPHSIGIHFIDVKSESVLSEQVDVCLPVSAAAHLPWPAGSEIMREHSIDTVYQCLMMYSIAPA